MTNGISFGSRALRYAALLVSILLCACSGDKATGLLKGRICNETTGAWAGSATVTLDDPARTSTTADAFGSFQFDGLVAGSYRLTITAPSYSGTRFASVMSGTTTDIGPARCSKGSGSVSGRVCDRDGSWLSGARVFTEPAGGGLVETATDIDGYFTLRGLAPATYVIGVALGALTGSADVTVGVDEAVSLLEPICIH